LRLILAAAVALPAVGALAGMVYSVRGTGDWDALVDAPGFALCGLFGLVPVAVVAIWVAARALVRRDAELHRLLACGCGVGALLATLSLGEAALVGPGLQEGRLPVGALVAVAAAWVYFVMVGLGHWHLSRLCREDRLPPGSTRNASGPG
jgi:hypothetical protein